MAVGIRLEFELQDPQGEAWATVGDVRRWLASAEKFGVADDLEIAPLLDERDDTIGFFVYGVPE